eukprot:1072281-Rhodomonas_salina.2
MRVWREQVLTACSRLDAHPPLQFRYLRALLRLHGWGRGGGDGPSNEEGGLFESALAFGCVCVRCPAPTVAGVMGPGGGGLRMGAELQERFIGLACTFCPGIFVRELWLCDARVCDACLCAVWLRIACGVALRCAAVRCASFAMRVFAVRVFAMRVYEISRC